MHSLTQYGVFITWSIGCCIISLLSSILSIFLHRRFITHVQSKRNKREHKLSPANKRKHLFYSIIQFISLCGLVFSVNAIFIFSVAFNKVPFILFGGIMCIFTTVASSIITNIVYSNYTQFSEYREMTYANDEEFEQVRTPSPISPVRPYSAVHTAVQTNASVFIALALVSNILSLLAMFSFYGTCSCFYPDHFSTTISRHLFDETHCSKSLNVSNSLEEGTICSVILNLPEKPQEEMIIKFLSTTESSRAYVRLYNGKLKPLDYSCHSFNLNNFQWDFHDRWIHTCELTNLIPNTEYQFEVYLTTPVETISEHKRRKFKTFGTDSVTFTNGGDMGINKQGLHMLEKATDLSPDFISIGGDIVYDDGFIACSHRWFQFYKFYDKHAVTTSGHMIPLLTAIGNHEAQYGLFHSSRNEILPYLFFNTHQVGVQALTRPLYHIHRLTSDYSLTVLDSAVISEQKDQSPWMERQWSTEYRTTNKLVMYHSPLYPSSSHSFDQVVFNGRLYWEPLFSKYNVSLALENHDHIYKRSKPIKNNETGEKGTIYIGDGAMGVLYPQPHRNGYHERMEVKYHVHYVKCNKQGIHMDAIDHNGERFDHLDLNR